MENKKKICPFITAGAFANTHNTEWNKVPCFKEACMLWDSKRECCGILRQNKNEDDGKN